MHDSKNKKMANKKTNNDSFFVSNLDFDVFDLHNNLRKLELNMKNKSFLD